jgi:Flp pilus assembly protein TadB
LRLCSHDASIARRALAWALLVFNVVLLVVGGAQWGATVVGVGVVGTLLVIPLVWWRRRAGESTL